MTGFVQGACVVVLLTASVAVAQPAGTPKVHQPDHLALSSGGGVNDQLKQQGSGRAEQPPAEKTATDVSHRARVAVGESLWDRWNGLP
jgi:hypothetical protein